MAKVRFNMLEIEDVADGNIDIAMDLIAMEMEDSMRKAASRIRHANSLKDKERRNLKATRKANAEKKFSNRQGLDNGHYYLSVWNERGFYNTIIIEKKANRRSKRTLADDIREYEIALS